jgi:FMN phosphatase YigB (HAD superfamily)
MQTHSFDVFDTCVSRTFAHPRDLFYALGRQVAPGDLSPDGLHRFACSFQKQRIRAEKVAYRESGRLSEVTIERIYERFRPFRGMLLSRAELIGAELALERQSLFPIPAVVSHITRLRDAGHRIIFISDMYLPATMLGPILVELGVMHQGDALYVSCDAGCSKRDGCLFDHVLRTEGIAPEHLIHHGDDPLGDVRMAQARGIEARHVTAGALNRLERRIATDRTWRQLPRPPGDSFLAGFARRLRLHAQMEGNDLADDLAGIQCTLVVPLLLAYVSWLLDYARAERIERLYFVARDGHMLYRIAQVLARPDEDPEPRYLYGSRRAWTLPSWPWGDSTFDRSILIAGNRCTPLQILRRLNLDDESMHRVLDALALPEETWTRSLSRADSAAFLTRLRTNPVGTALIERMAADARKDALAYFTQEGMLDGRSWALVDSGWGLNAQAALKRILSAVDGGPPVRGIYLALARNHLSEAQAGKAASFVGPAGRLLASRTHLMDHCFFPAPHASTCGYLRQGTSASPMFDQAVRSAAEQVYANQLDQLAVVGARLLADDALLREEFRAHTPTIVAKAEQFISAPDKASVVALSGFHVHPDIRQERDAEEPLCMPLSVREMIATGARAMSKNKGFSTTPNRWLEGSIALSAPWVRWPMKAAMGVAHMRRRWLTRTRTNRA